MKDDSHLYIDAEALRQRGWTDALIKRFLGAPDRWDPVDHWANYKGKCTYFLERVHYAENSGDFRDAFVKSIKRRKLGKKQVESFLLARKTTSSEVAKWRESLTGEDIKDMRIFDEVTKLFEEIRRRGYRTPHKS
jgi:hypothetical protein